MAAVFSVFKASPDTLFREIPLSGEMSRSDKRVAVFARKRWHFALQNDGEGGVSYIAPL